MGLAASQARVTMLTGRIHDLGFALQLNCQEKIMWAMQSDALSEMDNRAMQALVNATNETQKNAALDMERKIQGELRNISNQDKILDRKATQLDTQIKAAEQELESAKKMIDSAIKRGFS